MAKAQIIYVRPVRAKLTMQMFDQLNEILNAERKTNEGICMSDIIRRAIEQYLVTVNQA